MKKHVVEKTAIVFAVGIGIALALHRLNKNTVKGSAAGAATGIGVEFLF